MNRFLAAALTVMAALVLPACGSEGSVLHAGIPVMTVGGELLSDGVDNVPPHIDFILHATPEPAYGVTVRIDSQSLQVTYSSGSIGARAPRPLPFGSTHLLSVHLPGIGSEQYHITIVPLTQCFAAWFQNAAGVHTIDISFSGAPVQSALTQYLPSGSIVWRSPSEVVLHPASGTVALHFPSSLPTAHGAHLAASLVETIRTWSASPGLLWDPALPRLPSEKVTAFTTGGSAALASLQHVASSVSILDPVGLSLGGDGSLLGNVSSTGAATAEVQHMAVMPVIQNAFSDPSGIEALLGSGVLETQFIDSARSRVTAGRYAGVNIDFENIPPSLRDEFTAFIGELATSFHAVGKQVSVDIPVSTLGSPNAAYDDAALSHEADAVIIMAYDENTTPGVPGPVAGETWVWETLAGMLPGMAVSHVVLGLPLYGRVWSGTEVHSCATPVCEGEVLALPDAFITEDFADPSVLLAGTDASGAAVTAAVSTEETVAAAAIAAARNHLAGIAVWSLGEEAPGLALP